MMCHDQRTGHDPMDVVKTTHLNFYPKGPYSNHSNHQKNSLIRICALIPLKTTNFSFSNAKNFRYIEELTLLPTIHCGVYTQCYGLYFVNAQLK